MGMEPWFRDIHVFVKRRNYWSSSSSSRNFRCKLVYMANFDLPLPLPRHTYLRLQGRKKPPPPRDAKNVVKAFYPFIDKNFYFFPPFFNFCQACPRPDSIHIYTPAFVSTRRGIRLVAFSRILRYRSILLCVVSACGSSGLTVLSSPGIKECRTFFMSPTPLSPPPLSSSS